MTDQEKIQVVTKIYEAFDTGDTQAVLSRLAKDVQWEFKAKTNYNIPWYVPGTGPECFTKFFAAVGSEVEIKSVVIHGINKVGPYVVALAEIDAKSRKTGKPLNDFEAHAWKVGEDGLVTHFRHIIDTLHHQDIGKV